MAMLRQARDFYVAAAGRTTDAETRTLLGDLAAAEAAHQATASELVEHHLGAKERRQKTCRPDVSLSFLGLRG
jgi:erythrin-vacuolar iron transport family protein